MDRRQQCMIKVTNFGGSLATFHLQFLQRHIVTEQYVYSEWFYLGLWIRTVNRSVVDRNTDAASKISWWVLQSAPSWVFQRIMWKFKEQLRHARDLLAAPRA